MTRLLFILACTLIPALGALAGGKSPSTAPSSTPARVAKTPQGLILNYQNESVDVILDELCQCLGLKLAKDVRINNRISVVSPTPISPEETWSLINVLVENTGFKVVQVGSEVKLVLNKNGQAVVRE